MRRKRKIGKFALILLLIAALIAALLLRFVFIVRNVDVVGAAGSFSEEAVVRAASIGFGKSIFRVNAQNVAKGINALGGLSCEDVRLQYPDTIRISVRTRNRTAMTLHLGKIHVLDENGYVVESLAQVPDEDLLYVSGMRVQGANVGEAIRADSAQLNAYCAVMQALRAHSAQIYVSELRLDDPENLFMITRTGVNVRLGNAENLSNKIAWMKSAAADLEQRGEYGGALDVSSGTKADYRSSAG